MTKFYGIYEGRVRGVFQNWNLVKTFVDGYPDAKFRSFATFEEADHYHKTGAIKRTAGHSDKLTVYTDGSFQNPFGGYGFVVVNEFSQFVGKNGMVPYEKCTNNIAELYAILMVLLTYDNTNIIIYTDCEYAVNTFMKDIKNWKRRGWLKSNGKVPKNLELIKDIDARMKNRTVTFKHVSSHTNNYFNDMADSLAKQAITQYITEHNREQQVHQEL